jgi:primosomal protein N' (replication factor Y)
MIVEVALLSANVPKPLSYRVPESLAKQVALGVAVSVPLQNRLTTGIVIAITSRSSTISNLKPLSSILDDVPALNQRQIELAKWIAQEYVAPLGRCCALMVPPGFTPKSSFVYSVDPTASRELGALSDSEKRIVEFLMRRGAMVESKMKSALRDASAWRSALEKLVKRGLVKKDSTLQPPKVQPQRATLVQLVIGESTLELALENLNASKRLQPQVKGRRADTLNYLQSRNGIAWADWIFAETGANRNDLTWLSDQGYVLLGDAERWRDPLADVDYIAKTPPPLTSDQQNAWDVIRESWRATNNGSHFLLRGVTGSGKTEIYMRAVEETLRQTKGAIVLVPEISLTPQTARRFLERFPGKVALIHSRLKPGERFDTWRRIRAGELPVVVGARSALFAPLPNVGLIILDEEHDSSYKQSAMPFYDARRVAMKYAELTDATLIIGSATPSLEAWHSAEEAKNQDVNHQSASVVRHLELPNRVRGHINRIHDQEARFGVYSTAQNESSTVAYQPMPDVQVIDMRAELRGGNTDMFSGALNLSLAQTLTRGEQAILFLNRRGAASCVLCRDCGHAVRCPNDDVPLTLHTEREAGSRKTKAEHQATLPIDESRQSKIVNHQSSSVRFDLKCHHCNHVEDVPAKCPACGGGRIRFIGIGTQSIESHIHEHFPKARVVRWDKDSASARGAADQMLQRFINQQADVLIGTQMIAKGLDLPMVTTVGVVLADVGLFLPDFRASERVFNLIEQVAGRAGRGLLPGRVIVQTYNPDHPAIVFAKKHDVQGFARHELAQRKTLELPPYTRLVKFEFADESNDKARHDCEMFARELRRRVQKETDVIGPTPCYFTRKNRRYRWQVLVRTQTPSVLLDGLEIPRFCVVDVDPINIL